MPMNNIAVIGIGAMGGGMARALLEANDDVSRTVTAYDRSEALTQAFYEESLAAGKARKGDSVGVPTSVADAVSNDTNCVLLVLLNEAQCENVCFEGKESLQALLSMKNHPHREAPPLVISCVTLTPAWARSAAQRLAAHGIQCCDCPTSGGPVRARAGDLTLMASGDAASLARARPVLDCLSRPEELYIIQGAAGQGSTVKLVHQLLAGVHICAAAEALALAAAAGLDVSQVYEIVNGAAGASWMFRDRGERMMMMKVKDTAASSKETAMTTVPVKSMLEIFVKDLDIVHAEAKRVRAPIPLASAALQQFIGGQGLGLSRQDDSQVVQVYETMTGTKVQAKPSSAADGVSSFGGSSVGDLWIMADGKKEEILEVGAEPRHQVVLQNQYIRALRVSFPPNDTTLAHRHAHDSLYFFLVDIPNDKLQVINHVQGNAPACDCMDFGEVRFGEHVAQPLVHKITNRTSVPMLCIDAEVLRSPPVSSPLPLVAPHHELIKTRAKCRVYKLTLLPGESVTVSYPFFYCTVTLQPGTVEKRVGGSASNNSNSGVGWHESSQLGDVAWNEPVMELTKTNTDSNVFCEFIAEWR